MAILAIFQLVEGDPSENVDFGQIFSKSSPTRGPVPSRRPGPSFLSRDSGEKGDLRGAAASPGNLAEGRVSVRPGLPGEEAKNFTSVDFGQIFSKSSPTPKQR